MNVHRTLALALLVASCASAGRHIDAPPNRGQLVIVGGGGTPDSVVDRMIALAGGKGARAVVLAQASSRPEAGEESVAVWKERGLEHVASIDLADVAAARTAIASADLIWMPGGDQSRLLRAFDESGLVDALRARHAAGAVVGGTSAGAAVLSELMIVGGETADLKVVKPRSVELVAGLDLFPGAIVDQHFLRRQRFNRLLSAVLDHPDLVGIGIDERTAIVVVGNGFEVLGENGVLVLDARSSAVELEKEGAPHAASDVRLALLRDGMKYDLGRSGGRR